MDTIISQKKIGSRVAQLRKQKGLTQEELAKNLGISRTSLAQIELGSRSIKIEELQKLSLSLKFPINAFLSSTFIDKQPSEEKETTKSREAKIRISVPKLQSNKFKNILLYILERCAGKPNVGETVLYKLLYFSDFNYYELYEEHLTGARYRKLPYGPVPLRLDTIISEMLGAGLLKKVKTDYHGYVQTRYLPLGKANLTQLRASEKEVIDRVIEQMSDWSAAAISEYSHKDMPWLATKEGDYISYNLAFYRELPYSVRMYDDVNE